MKKLLATALAVAALGACHRASDTTNTASAGPEPSALPAGAGAADDTSNRANPPIAGDQNRQTNAAAPGSNSFTEGQAMGHLANAGYTNVTGMTQDANGVWHGQATDKNGKNVAVTVDYQGSITAK